MAQRQLGTSGENIKRLSAQDINRLMQEIFQNHFRLEREGCICGAHLPGKLLTKELPCAADLVYIPYHGQHEENDKAIRRGMAKSGATHFHCYATLFAVKNSKRYALALTLVRRSEKVLDVLQRLLNRVKSLEVRIKRLLLDRGFDSNAVIGYLGEQSFPTIIALTIWGKTGGTRALLRGRKSYVTTYSRHSTTSCPWRVGGSGSGKSSSSARDSAWKSWYRYPHDCGLLILDAEASTSDIASTAPFRGPTQKSPEISISGVFTFSGSDGPRLRSSNVRLIPNTPVVPKGS